MDKLDELIRYKVKNTNYNTVKDLERLFRIRDYMQKATDNKITLAEAYQNFSETKNMDYSKLGGTCIELANDMKKELGKLGINSNIVACKTNGMLNEDGNRILEYGHFTNIFSELENGKRKYSIVDLGMFIPDVISFYEKEETELIKLSNGKYAKVEFNSENEKLPYKLCIGNVKDNGSFEYSDYAEFNPDKNITNESANMYKDYFRVAPRIQNCFI